MGEGEVIGRGIGPTGDGPIGDGPIGGGPICRPIIGGGPIGGRINGCIGGACGRMAGLAGTIGANRWRISPGTSPSGRPTTGPLSRVGTDAVLLVGLFVPLRD